MLKNLRTNQAIFVVMTLIFVLGLFFVMLFSLKESGNGQHSLDIISAGILPIVSSVCLFFASVYMMVTGLIFIDANERRVSVIYLAFYTFYYSLQKFQYCAQTSFFYAQNLPVELLFLCASVMMCIAFTLFSQRFAVGKEAAKPMRITMDALFVLLVVLLPICSIAIENTSVHLIDMQIFSLGYMLFICLRSMIMILIARESLINFKTLFVSLILFITFAAFDVIDFIAGSSKTDIAAISSFGTLGTVTFVWINIMRRIYAGIEETNDIREQLMENKVQLMLSQIKPHFIYNSLNSINILIPQDPVRAQRMVKNFSDYLRKNMNAMNNSGMIPFKEEMEHINAYVGIEEIRFPNIQVVYEIDETNFYVPILSVEPIVENAIKHGAAKCRNGGKVSIRAYRSKNDIYIEVKDNGMGFDAEHVAEAKPDSLGIKNVRYRVENMTGGELIISSEKGKGTLARFRFPAERVKEVRA